MNEWWLTLYLNTMIQSWLCYQCPGMKSVCRATNIHVWGVAFSREGVHSWHFTVTSRGEFNSGSYVSSVPTSLTSPTLVLSFFWLRLTHYWWMFRVLTRPQVHTSTSWEPSPVPRSTHGVSQSHTLGWELLPFNVFVHFLCTPFVWLGTLALLLLDFFRLWSFKLPLKAYSRLMTINGKSVNTVVIFFQQSSTAQVWNNIGQKLFNPNYS